MKKGYVISLVIIFILLLSVIYVGRDYSLYIKNNSEESNEAIVINEGNLSINYSSGSKFTLKNISDGYSMEKKFSITNMGNSTIYYAISLTDIDDSISSDGSLKLSLNSTNNGAVLSNIDFPDSASEITGLVRIAPQTTQSYKITFNYSGSASVEDYIKGALSVKLRDNDTQTFADIILINNKLNKATTNPGKLISNANEGLIASNDDDGVTYYFRGNVVNNYVKFANHTWRIVRINGDNSVRLVLDNTIESSYAYNTNTIGENRDDYYTLVGYENSSLKKKLEEWYTANISEFGINVQESNFCSDTNISREETDISYYSSYVRINDNESPLFNCIGNLYTANVGLLSVDEVVYAGAFKSSENKDYYLYNPNITNDWWVGSPYSVSGDHTVSMFNVIASNGSISTGNSVTKEMGIRPVISLRDTVTVSGTGTLDDPYIVQ